MEGLHNAFDDAMGNGLISEIWKTSFVFSMFSILLKINIHKYNIYGIEVNEDEVYNMASNTGCIGGNVPFNYLGLPIGSNMKSIGSWKILIDRFRLRLSTWKASLLSIGGRLTLIKSVLGSLNIGSLKAFNFALLQKWRWKLFTSPNDLWVKVVKAFHGHEGGFDNNGCSFKGTWANIVGSSNFLHSKGTIVFIALIKTEIVSSSTVSLMDNGIGIGPGSILNLGLNGTFTVNDARNIIDQKTPLLFPLLLGTKSFPA
ncbi:hypothetical protein Tco_1365837, partial [Tanacetum coccineum]